jgi:hypothetical protein
VAEWNADEALKSLAQESQLLDADDKNATAKRLFREAGPTAAAAIVHIAQYGDNERLRLDAARYITERNLGKVGGEDAGGDPLEELLASVVKDEDAAIANARAVLGSDEGGNDAE